MSENELFERHDPDVRACDLRANEECGLVATGAAQPHLSWRMLSDRPEVKQSAFVIEIANDREFKQNVLSSGRVVSSAQIGHPWPGSPLRSRQSLWWRVKIWTESGGTAWSEPARLEAGLLNSSDWVARPISSDRSLSCEAVLLFRRAFIVGKAISRARLYVTAYGVHSTRINGRLVSEDLLEPGWTAYQSRLLYAVYDVSDQIALGENVISAMVGEGWWARNTQTIGYRSSYANSKAYLAQLEIVFLDGSSLVIASDESWRVCPNAYLLASLYDGVEIDLREEPIGWLIQGYDDQWWDTAKVLGLTSKLELRESPAVSVVQRYSVVPRQGPSGVLLVDTGQNLAGCLRLKVRGRPGAALVVKHAEILDDSGRLFTKNLMFARATDKYVLRSPDTETVEPIFTYHGFRYAEITIDPDIVVEQVEVLVIASNVTWGGSFECSNKQLNQLFQNVQWSQRSNFVSIPTDCPQRGERLGWTGDIQVFAPTACLNADVRSFLASWLKDLSIEQRGDGSVPSIVPNILHGHRWEYGIAGWADAAVVVPWTLYLFYGDCATLERQYPSMCAWVDYCASRVSSDGTWTGDQHLGDWLDPSASQDKPGQGTTDANYIASAYLSRSASLVSKAANVLGKPSDALRYRGLADSVATATWKRWAQHAMTTQTGCAIALGFDIAPCRERPHLAKILAQLVNARGGKIGTGFLGTPLVLDALSDNGQIDTAYRVLMNTDCPGWMYEVQHGATTIWERWDSLGPDGKIQTGEISDFSGDGQSAVMLSFNHYALGAVSAWLYKVVAGLWPAEDDPGFRTTIFAPMPGGGLRQARASVRTAYGRTSIAWQLDNSRLNVELEIPAGANGRFICPPGYKRGRPPSVQTQQAGQITSAQFCGDRIQSGKFSIWLDPE